MFTNSHQTMWIKTLTLTWCVLRKTLKTGVHVILWLIVSYFFSEKLVQKN